VRRVLLADDHAQDVGEVRAGRAGAVSDGVRPHHRQVAEALDRGGEDRRAGRRHELHRHAAGEDRGAAQQLDDGRRRDRHHAVLGPDHAESGRHRRREDPLDAELRDGERRARDVDDRVDGADLVERHVLDVAVVHDGLRLGQAAEDAARERVRLGGEAGLVQEPADVRVRPRDGAGTGPHVHAHRVQAVRLHVLGLDLERLQRQACEPGRDVLEVGAGVDERAERHVARDAGDAVEVGDPHGRPPRTMRSATSAAPNPLSMFTTATPGAHDDIMPSSAASPSNDAP
jgi:hypothetical protein